MTNTPKYIIAASLFAFVSPNLWAVVLPEQANANAGIRVTADFDYSETNMNNNKAYFEDDSNFFNGKGIEFNANSHAFLNAKKATINTNKGGKSRKVIGSIHNAGAKGYSEFGASQTYDLGANDTVTGMGVDTGNGNEKFEVFGGSTGSAMNVSIQVRSKSQAESHGSHSHADGHNDNTIIGHSPLVGNVMRLHGMGIQAATSDGRVKTNPFALAATYTQEDYDATFSLSELEELINGCLFLGWINPALDGNPNDISDTDRWVHAVQGNYDNMPDNPNRFDEHGVIGDAVIGTLQDYIDGTSTSINGLTKAAGEIRVGDHGGDPLTNEVWAIVDHNSDFAVIPEPSTYALFGGIICLATLVSRRRK